MKIEQIWQNDEWTGEARRLISGLTQFPSDSKIIIILRHSHRKHSDDPWRVSKLKLTSLGHEIARIFGENLPLERELRLFYSFLDRCKETAEDILRGFKSKGGIGFLMNNLDVLVDIGMEPDTFFTEITNHSLINFFFVGSRDYILQRFLLHLIYFVNKLHILFGRKLSMLLTKGLISMFLMILLS